MINEGTGVKVPCPREKKKKPLNISTGDETQDRRGQNHDFTKTSKSCKGEDVKMKRKVSEKTEMYIFIS